MSTEILDFEKECDRTRRQVFSTVAHDFVTPLACIIGSLGTLDQMKEKLSPEQHDSLVKIALEQAQLLDVLVAETLHKAKS